MFLRGVPAQKDRHEGDEGGAQPGRGDHAHGRVGVHEVVVVERFADGVEPAQCLLSNPVISVVSSAV